MKKDNWYKLFMDYVIKTWTDKGTVTNEKEAREYLDAMLFLLSGYRFKCLIVTLIELDDLIEKFENENKIEPENN